MEKAKIREFIPCTLLRETVCFNDTGNWSHWPGILDALLNPDHIHILMYVNDLYYFCVKLKRTIN